MVVPNLIGRSQGLIDFSLRSDPLVASYQFNSARTLDAAFGGGTSTFTVGRGRSLESPTIQRTGRGRDESSMRGLTRVSLDLNDYSNATIPGDGAMSFWNVQEINQVGTTLPAGPVLVVPPTQMEGYLTLSGSAPNVTGTTTGLPPVGVMVIAFPRSVTSMTIWNDDNRRSLFIGTEAGSPEIELISSGQTPPPPTLTGIAASMDFSPTSFSLLYLRGGGSPVAFRLTAFMPGGPPR